MKQISMKKWLKNWWFSILMFAFAIAITLYVAIGYFLIWEDDIFIYSLLMINCISPVLLILIIGIANMPRKENKE